MNSETNISFSPPDFLSLHGDLVEKGYVLNILSGTSDPPAVATTVQYVERVLSKNEYLPVNDLDVVTTLNAFISAYVIHGSGGRDRREILLAHLAASLVMHAHATAAEISGAGTAFAPLAMCRAASALGPPFTSQARAYLQWHRHRIESNVDAKEYCVDSAVFVDLAILRTLVGDTAKASQSAFRLMHLVTERLMQAGIDSLSPDLGGHATWSEEMQVAGNQVDLLAVESQQIRILLDRFAGQEAILLKRWRSQSSL